MAGKSKEPQAEALLDVETFLRDWSLYRSVPDDRKIELASTIRTNDSVVFDAYCVHCERDATFRSRRGDPLRDAISARYRADDPSPFFSAVFECTRKGHLYLFAFEISDRGLRKIGQSPSYGDIQIGALSRDIRILDKPQQAYLAKAVRLFSSDVAMGAFVYLRRPFEDLVTKAYAQRMAQSGPIDDFERMRVGDRVKALVGYLSKLMTDNPAIYGVLSKGLHELTEEECAAYFPVIFAGIKRMLQEEAHRRRAAKEDAELTAALSAIGAGASDARNPRQ